MLKNPQEQIQRGQQGFQRLIQYFSVNQMVEKTAQLYQRILKDF